MSTLVYMSEVIAPGMSSQLADEEVDEVVDNEGVGHSDEAYDDDEDGGGGDSDSKAAADLTPVTNCCLKKKCYQNVSPKIQNDLFNCFWRIGDYAKQNYFLVGLMSAQSPKQLTKCPVKKNKSLSWMYWVDIRGRKVQVCKGFFLAVYGVSDKRLRVLQTKLVNGEPLEDQRGKYDVSRRANQHTVRRKHEDQSTTGADLQTQTPTAPKSAKRTAKRTTTTPTVGQLEASIVTNNNNNTITIGEIIRTFPPDFTTV